MKVTAITDEDMAEMAAAVEAMAADPRDIDIAFRGDQEIADSFLPLGRKLKAKLLKQNIEGLSLTNKQVGHVRCKFMKAGKFTIVELARNGKHYHGLSSRADCDKGNWFTGVAVAFNRAFNDMMEETITQRNNECKHFIKKMYSDATIGAAIVKSEHGKLTKCGRLLEMMENNRNEEVLIVKTPIICNDFFDAIKHYPPAIRML